MEPKESLLLFQDGLGGGFVKQLYVILTDISDKMCVANTRRVEGLIPQQSALAIKCLRPCKKNKTKQKTDQQNTEQNTTAEISYNFLTTFQT